MAKEKASKADWNKIAESAAFKELIRQKRSFVVPSTIFFFVFYFTLPILTSFTTALNGKAIGAITWAYVFAFAQFAMTWILCHMYLRKSNSLDELVEKVKKEAKSKGVDAA